MAEFTYEPSKLVELIIYITGKCNGHRRFGKTILNKMLFFSDFIAYERLGKPITGASYFRLPYGPAPKAMKPILGQLTDSNDIVLIPNQTLSGTEFRPTPRRVAVLDCFSADEIAIVDQVIETLKDKSAEEVSELSHLHVGWQLVSEEEDIPYCTAYCQDQSNVVLTEEETIELRKTDLRLKSTENQ